MRNKGYKTRVGTSYSVSEIDFFAVYDDAAQEWKLQMHYWTKEKTKVASTEHKQGYKTIHIDVEKTEEKSFKTIQAMMLFVKDLCGYTQKNKVFIQNFAKIWTKNLKKVRSFLTPDDKITDKMGDKYIVLEDYLCIFAEIKYLSRTNIQEEKALDFILDWHKITGKVATEKVSYQQLGRDILKDRVLKQVNKKYKDYEILNAQERLKFSSGKEYELIDAASKGGFCSLTTNKGVKRNRLVYTDAKTMYWSVLVMFTYPYKLEEYKEKVTLKEYEGYLAKGYAICADCRLTDVRLREEGVPCMRAKAALNDETADGKKNNFLLKNGWVKYADEVILALTNVDIVYLASNYEFKVQFKDVFIYKQAHLPRKIIDIILENFCGKEEFDEGSKEYDLVKAVLNGGHGMMAMRNWQQTYGRNKRDEVDWEKMAEEYNAELKNRVGSLIWYCWSTAYARLRVVMLAQKLGDSWLYSDTDSVIFIYSEENMKIIEELNRKWRVALANVLNKLHSKYSVENLHRLGEWCEKHVKNKDGKKLEYVAGRFVKQKTYCLEDEEGNLHITMSGLAGKNVEPWLKKNGGLEAFEDGLTIPAEVAQKKIIYYSEEGKGYTEKFVDFEIGNDAVNILYKQEESVR